MDLLTDLLSRIRLASPLLSELRMGHDVSLGLGGGGAHSPFHYIVAGECRILAGAETINLSAGSLALLPRWPDYRMETGNNHTRLEILDVVADHGLPVWSAERGVDQPLLLEVGPGPCTCRILSGIVSLEQPELALLGRVLPEILVIDGAATTLGPWVDAAVDFIATETSPASAGFTVAAARIVELLFVIAIRSWVLNHNPGEFWLRDIADSKISKAIFAMQDDLSEKWTLSKLAKIAGQSRSSFAEQFRQVMGETPMRYLVKLRIHTAEHDLASGHSSVAEIAHSRGYQSSYAFTRAFRSIHGVTPAQFRRRATIPTEN